MWWVVFFLFCCAAASDYRNDDMPVLFKGKAQSGRSEVILTDADTGTGNGSLFYGKTVSAKVQKRLQGELVALGLVVTWADFTHGHCAAVAGSKATIITAMHCFAHPNNTEVQGVFLHRSVYKPEGIRMAPVYYASQPDAEVVAEWQLLHGQQRLMRDYVELEVLTKHREKPDLPVVKVLEAPPKNGSTIYACGMVGTLSREELSQQGLDKAEVVRAIGEEGSYSCQKGKVEWVEDSIVTHSANTVGGFSGGPLLQFINKTLYMVGIHLEGDLAKNVNRGLLMPWSAGSRSEL